MSSKQKLKAAKEALDSKEFDKARNAIESILTFEPMNYNANVFHGLALFNLGDDASAEKAYRRAIESNPTLPLAWRGLANFYEKRQNWDRYTKTLFELLELFNEASDATKVAETIQKIVQFYKDQNNIEKLTECLHWYLPNSPYYDLLSTLPPPDHTQPLLTTTYEAQCAIYDSLPILIQLKDIHQANISKWRTEEFNKRKTRLGAPRREIIEKDLINESSKDSKLEPLYLEILNHQSTSDELRREVEAALFKFKHDHLLATSTKDKDLKNQLLNQVMAMANGMVTINVPNILAWTVVLEWWNTEYLTGYNAILLRRFQTLFPEHILCGVINGLFAYLPAIRLEDDPTPIMPNDMALNAVIDGIESNPNSLFTHRVLSYIYDIEKQYDDAIAVSEAGSELCKVFEKDSGLRFDLHKLSFERSLAKCFTYNYPPKYHMRAMGSIQNVCNERPQDVEVLIAQGTCLEYANKWDQAREVFEQVIAIDESNLIAKEERGWCDVMKADYSKGRTGLQEVLDELSQRDDIEDVATHQARCYFKLGKCSWEQGGQEQVNSYTLFIQSIKHVNKFAPSFTHLGLYYLHVAQPTDIVRASKCFQKAFELDSRETEAARWLADGFANEKDWDLVEIVARRTVEGEGSTVEELVKGRYLSRNAWAWKAIGVVELNRHNYGAAVEAFQIALRANTTDNSSWLRLGESYAAAGRHAAALKTFNKSRELDSSESNWLALYAIADVLRLMGFHASAIETLNGIFDENNLAVVISLGQSYISQARYEVVSGFVGRAVESYRESIKNALIIVRQERYLRVAWKVLNDAFYGLAKLAALDVNEDLTEAVEYVVQVMQEEQLIQKVHSKELIDFGYILNSINTPEAVNRACINVAILTSEFAITLDFGRPDSVGSTWYDLTLDLEELAKQTQLVSQTETRKQVEKLSVTAIRNALRSEPGNDDYWNTLGNLVFESDARLAQHSYIKAIELDGRNPTYWTNLGFLYISQKDLELAIYALKKSQTVDPDYVYAWVGLSIIASLEGRHNDAKMLYEHSFTISGGAELESNFGFAYNAAITKKDVKELHRECYAMQRFTEGNPGDYAGLHLYALLRENLEQYDEAGKAIERCVELLEAAYEDAESAEVESHYALANVTLGRIRLATGSYDAATEAFSTALSLAQDVPTKIQALLGVGLSSNQKGSPDLDALEKAFKEEQDVDAGVIIAQIQYENDTESAISRLLECVEIDGGHLGAISTLVAIGILENDDGLLDAALAEINAMPSDKRIEVDSRRSVHRLMMQHSLMSVGSSVNSQHLTDAPQGDTEATIRMLTKEVNLQPYAQDLKRDLGKLLLATGKTALGANVTLADDSHESRLDSTWIATQALAKADKGMLDEALKDIQRALYIDPSSEDNWKTLALIKLLK
ncbi:TPR-like protein [Wallemia mellicola]|nr:TPR-like protein [Wallemia mellicola]TIC46393.1 TPR-like protein [Wallemia mellicola]